MGGVEKGAKPPKLHFWLRHCSSLYRMEKWRGKTCCAAYKM